jgi:calcineurin-like phosphoesterase family protein
MIGFGDLHIRRGLPHTFTNSEGKDHRYEYLKKMLRTILSEDDINFSMGDVTDKKNQIDGKILEDLIKIIGKKKILFLEGNHDRSADGGKYSSLVDILDLVLPNVKTVKDIYKMEIGGKIVLFTSYYATDDDIKAAIKAAIKKDKPVYVLGHWSFYNSLHKSGRELLEFAKVAAKRNVTFFLGHEHNPNKITYEGTDLGYYIGCVNPKIFGERQGRMLEINQNGYSFKGYPFGEKFVKMEYSGELPDFDNPEETYLKVYTTDINDVELIDNKYGDKPFPHFSIPIIRKSEEVNEISVDGNIKTKDTDDYILEAIEKNEFDPDNLMPLHNKIKERA